MGEGTVTVQGLDALEKLLREIPDRLAKNVLVGATRAAARTVQREAQKLAPRSEEQVRIRAGKGKYTTVPPGWLVKNISIWRVRDRQTKYAVAFKLGIRAPKKGPTAYYAMFLEKGTSKMKAHPFLRPAFDTMKDQAVEAMKTYLAGRIEKELNK